MNAPWVKVLKAFPEMERNNALKELTEQLFKVPVVNQSESSLFQKILSHKEAGAMLLAKRCMPQDEVRRGVIALSAAIKKKLSKYINTDLLHKATKKEIAEALHRLSEEDKEFQGHGGEGVPVSFSSSQEMPGARSYDAAKNMSTTQTMQVQVQVQFTSAGSGSIKRAASEAIAIDDRAAQKIPKRPASSVPSAPITEPSHSAKQIKATDDSGGLAGSSSNSAADSEFVEDCLGPWPLPMDKGNRWVQFCLHFKKEISSLTSKSGVDKKTVSSVLFACMKMLDGRQKVQTWEKDNKMLSGAQMPKQLQDFNDLWQKAVVGDNEIKCNSVLNDVMSYDQQRTLPLLNALQKRADKYQEETKQMKESQSADNMASKACSSRIKASMEAAIFEKLEWVAIKKKDHEELKHEVGKLDRDIQVNKKNLQNLAWDDVNGHARIVAKVKQQLKQRHEKKILVEEVAAELKETNDGIEDLRKWLSTL